MLNRILNKAFIIGELSANHNKDYDLALRTIDAIAESGADAVKVQTFVADSMTLDIETPHFKAGENTIWKGKKLYDLYRESSLPYEWHDKLKLHAENQGLIFFSTPFDKASVDFLESLHVPLYKIASLEITDIPLIEYVASKGKPILLSTGVAFLSDIELAVNTIRNQKNDQIIILKCTSAYPTPYEEVNLRSMPLLGKIFNCYYGISDHTPGSVIPLGAVALGAKIIEKHFILDRNKGGVDSAFSMEPPEFKEMVRNIRNLEKALIDSSYKLFEKSIEAKKRSRSLIFIKDLKKGDIISENNIKSLRPSIGLHPKYLYEIIGKVVQKDIKRGTPVSWDLFEA